VSLSETQDICARSEERRLKLIAELKIRAEEENRVEPDLVASGGLPVELQATDF
jgi:hypothetical protein